MASVLKVDKLDPQSGTALEIGTSGDTINVPSGVTLDINSGATLDATGATITGALANTPAWDARASTNQTGLTSGGWTKIEFDAEVFDTDSAYDTTNDKFVVPAGAGGKYFITSFAKINNAGSTYTLMGTGMRITVNGANRKESILFAKNTTPTIYAEGKGVSCVLALDASDYVEVYAYYQDTTAATGSITGGSDYDTFFTGFKLIG